MAMLCTLDLMYSRLKYLLVIAITLIIVRNISVFSQENSEILDSATISVKYITPKYEHSSVFQLGNSQNIEIKKGEFSDIQYSSYKEIFERKLPVNILSQANFDYFSSFSTMGAMPSSNALHFNNRTLNYLDFASYNLSTISPEFTEKVEFLVGSDAVIFADNSSGSLINLQEIRYNTAKPYSRLWFNQGGYEYLAADGIFSQNFLPNWNFTFGFRNSNNDGKFKDTWANLWSVRGILRYNPNNYSSLSLVHNYTNYGIGTGGGVNYDSVTNVFESISANSFYTGMNEREFRHDLTLTYTDKFDTLSNQAIQMSAYLSRAEWDRDQGEIFRFIQSDTIGNLLNYSNILYGANFSYEIEFIKNNFLKIGSDLNYFTFDKTYMYNEYSNLQSALFAHIRLNFTDNLGLSGGARLSNKFNKVGVSIGSKLLYSLDDIEFYLDASYAERIPEISEDLSLKNEKNMLLIVGNNILIDSISNFNITAFYRTQQSTIVANIDKSNNTPTGISFTNEDKYNTYGANINFKSHLFNLLKYQIIANLNIATMSYSEKKILPTLSAIIDLNYEYNLGKSILRIGAEAKFASSFNGLRFIPFYKAYIISDYHSSAGLQSFSPYAYIKIGDATIRAMFENAFDNNYYNIAVMPNNGRNFRLSFSWTFLEN
ncbi:MAG TPA: hypothetical protein PLE30_08295 [Candidatus Kapabacteria bacterium]|nr:hypothetical protein [Candidatus Kapabacteria bacterium]